MKQTAADYRREYNSRLEKIIALEERAEDLQRQFAAALRLRNDICYGPKEDFDLDAYSYYRGRMAELEKEIGQTKRRAALHQEIWEAMDKPKPRGPRKSYVGDDGIRRKIYRETV